MPSLFPANPEVGDTFTSADQTVWEWNGEAWTLVRFDTPQVYNWGEFVGQTF
jgi:hypothetical protein